MFKRLRREMEVDVAMRNKSLKESQHGNGVAFSVKDGDDESFAVIREVLGLTASASFVILGPCIKAMDA
jgi:hypothetical protein